MHKYSTVFDFRLAALIMVLLTYAVPSAGQDCIDYRDYMHVMATLRDSDPWQGSTYWTVLAGEGNTLYTCEYDLLEAYDISTPGQFQLLWTMDDGIPDAIDMVLNGDYLILLSENQLMIIRVEGIPEPAIVTSVDHGGYYFGGRMILYDDYCYFPNNLYGYDEISVFDLSNPEDPIQLDGVSGPDDIHYLAVDGSNLYATGGYPQEGLQVYDLVDPQAPNYLVTYPLSGFGEALDVTGGQAVVAHGDTLWILDVSTPIAPQPIGTLPWDGNTAAVQVEGEIAYILTSDGLRTVDLNDPANPLQIGSLRTGFGEKSLHLAGDIAYVGGYDNVAAVSIVNPHSPPYIGGYELFNMVQALFVFGTTAYVGVENYFIALDVTDPVQPDMLGYIQLPDDLKDIIVSGTTAYAACSYYGLHILDVADPETITVLDVVYTPGEAKSIHQVDDLIYMACDEGGMTIVDVADPQDGQILSWVNIGGNTEDLSVAGDYACLVDYYIGLLIYDITDPTAPALVGLTGVPGYPVALTLYDEYAYVATTTAGIWVVDITDPTWPEPVQQIAAPPYNSEIAIQGSVMYMANNSQGVLLYDVTDPDIPTLIGATASGGGCYSVFPTENLVYLGGDEYLLIVQSQCRPNSVMPGTPPTRSLLMQNYPNPFNPVTEIHFDLAEEVAVELVVFDVAGRRIANLHQGNLTAGRHSAIWNGTDTGGRQVPSGIYFARLVTDGDPVDTIKLTLLK